MKVAIFTTQFHPLETGVSNVIKNNIDGMRKLYKNIEFEIFTATFSGPSFFINYKVHRFRLAPICRGYGISLKMINKLDADIVHIHHFGYYPATAGFISSKISRIPLVFTPHFHPPVFSIFRWGLFWTYNFTQGIPIMRLADVVLPITEYEKKQLIKYGGNPYNMAIIPNSINVDIFRIKNTRFKNKKVVLFVGSMNEHKGCDKLFLISQKILKRRKNILFVFIGKGNLKEDLIRNSRNYKNNYLFFQNISIKDLVKWYNMADVLVLPSKYEAFGMVLVEAMACGTPVIATRVGGIPEVVYDKNLLVDYGDWDKMEKLIEYVIDSGYKEKHRKRIRSYVVKKFSIPVVSNKLYKIYKSLV